jgi:hypothetical protein
MFEKPCLGMRGARSFRTRRAHPSAKFTLRAISGPSPLGHPSRAPPWRGGLCTPANEASLAAGDRPTRPPAYHQRTGANDMPRLVYGLATRTRRPRPSENTDLRVIPGFCPIRPSCLGLSPWRGGLRTPANEASLAAGDRPFRPPAYHQRTGANDMPRLAYGLATRARRPRPSEETALRAISGPSPARPCVLG